jgi:transcriptional regulator with XRE-family HTH domain
VQIPRLREWREARALTQVELASLADISPRSVAGYEAGSGARPPTVRRLAEALEVEISDLVGEPDPKKAVAPPSRQRSFYNHLAEERREAFIRRVEQYYAARTAHYSRRLEEAEQGSVPPLSGWAGAVLLSDDAWAEFRDLPEFVNDALAEFWALNPELSENMQVAMARAVGRAMDPFAEIVRRIAVRAWELGETEEQKAAAARRREQIREQNRKRSA